jgi:hypothetical protein
VNKIEVHYLEKKLGEFGEKLFQKVDERINNLEKFVKEGKSEQTSVPDKSDNSEERMIDVMMSSMDLESVEKSLDDLGFGKVEETDTEVVFFCLACFENNPPPPADKNVNGCFTLDLTTFAYQKLSKPEQQPRSLRNLKVNIKSHVQKTQYHKHKVEEKIRKEKIFSDKISRNKTVGLNLFRIRYTGLKQHQPRLAFEESVLTAKLNGTDVGNLNHSRMFAKEIDVALFETMKDDLKEALTTKLDATNEKRPMGLLFDKMTPAKETGQIHAIMIPVPENNLAQPLIVPVCLDVPTVKDHSIATQCRSRRQAA